MKKEIEGRKWEKMEKNRIIKKKNLKMEQKNNSEM